MTKAKGPGRSEARSITLDRVIRLYRLVRLLADGPVSRANIVRRLRLNQRGFYRDIELLRAASIPIGLQNDRYLLELSVKVAAERLPFPDAQLTLGQARRLAQGSTAAHRKLKHLIDQIVTDRPRKIK